jgi:hypothetical protein
LEVGEQSIKLDFDGFTIRNKQVNGPYKLDTLSIYNEENDLILEEFDLYYTGFYNYEDFDDVTTIGNEEPSIYYVNPGFAETSVDRPPEELNCTVYDEEGEQMTIMFRWKNHLNIWETLEIFTMAFNGLYSYIPPDTDEWKWGNTTYIWSINATDGISWTNQTYQFTTKGNRYDVDNNDIVDFRDAGLCWAHRTSTPIEEDLIYDVDGNGIIDFRDAGLCWANRN